MPILHIRALPQKDPTRINRALKKTCVAIAKVCECDPSQVWGTWEEIRPGWYIEGESDQSFQPMTTHPPMAQLTCFEGNSEQKIEELLQVASSVLSEQLGVGDNIFMTYHEAKSGKVISGNRVVRKKL